MEPNLNCIYSFAGFVFDPESGELAQNGIRIRLGKQSADILAIVLLNAGSLVTRQRLREILWPGGEVVNHEKIINNAISRLRYVFQDDPQAPAFIERVPKRGYRWIMPIEQIERTRPLPRAGNSLTPDCTPQMHTPQVELALGTAAEPVVSTPQTVFSLRRQRSPWPFLSVAALLLLAVGVWSWRPRRTVRSQTQPPPQIISLAVAPLDASGSGANALAQSFQLDLTDALAQLPQIQVRSTHSVNQLRLNDASLPAYSNKLGLDVILFGSFQRTLRNCDLQFELVRVRDSVHLATFRYSVPADQLGTLRDTIRRDIFARLRLSGSGDEPSTGGTTDPQAYRSYLQARYQFSLQSSDSLSSAVREYNSAIERDPRFATAYIGLAQTYLIAALHHNLMPPRDALRKAGDAVQQAQALHNSSAEVHSILGFIRYYRDWNLDGGIDEERQAIRIEPHQAIYHQWLALMLSGKGQYSEALSEIALAQADDPYWPSLYVTEAYISVDAMDMQRLMRATYKLNELLPDSPVACDTMANALWYTDHPVEAIAQWRRLAVLEHDPVRVAMEDRGLAAYRQSGIKGYARVRIEEIEKARDISLDPNDFEPEEWYMAAGDTPRAIEALRQRATSQDPSFVEKTTGGIFRSVRSDPEFIALLHQTGLAAQLGHPDIELSSNTSAAATTSQPH